MGYVLKAVLSSAQHPEYGQITVPFPIPDEKYDRMIELLEPLEIGDALRQDCRVDELDSFYTVLNRLVGSLVNFDELDYRGYSSTAQHRMLVIPEEHWSKALKLLYAEKFDWSRLVYDITYTSIGAAVVEDFYDENVVFLRFCFEKELLKKNPLDRQGRILRMVYLNQDLTKAGKYLFPRLMQKFLVFTDRNGKTSLETMLKRWYTQLEKEYRNQTAG